jgi:preprotein translocase subunit SecG
MGDDTMKEKEEINWFTRIMVILLALFIVFVIVMKLFYYKTPFEIDEYIIICLLILSILVLSESYNSFSIGKIFSLTKKVEEKEKGKEDK